MESNPFQLKNHLPQRRKGRRATTLFIAPARRSYHFMFPLMADRWMGKGRETVLIKYCLSGTLRFAQPTTFMSCFPFASSRGEG
jgi:hypothetical protein